MRRPLLSLFAATAICAFGNGLYAQSGLPAAAETAYKQGLDFEQRQQYDSALDSFRAAGKQAGGSSLCTEAVERVQMKMDKYRDAAATANGMAAAASTPEAKAHADRLESEAWYRQYFAFTEGEGVYDKNFKKATDALRNAEAAAARGVAADPADEPVRMLHARVLAALKRDEDASREFTACAAVPGATPAECAHALRLAHNVEAARGQPSPDFHATTLDGKSVSLDSLAGKVVLLDFWATWCPVCRRDSDYVQSLLDSFPDENRFVLLEVDADEKKSDWLAYLDENRLHGVQLRDEGKDMQGAFHVGGFPTYIILDGDGTTRLRTAGINGDLRGTVRKLLAEQDAQSGSGTRAPLSKAGGE